MLGLEGKAAIVTGSGSGIGRGIALTLAAAGVHVVLTDVDEAGLAETVRLIGDREARVVPFRQDVADEDQWRSTVSAAREALGGLHILVNNAGIFQYSETFSTSLELYQRVMAVNAQGTFLGMKHAIPLIAESGGGSVVNISSMAGLVGLAKSAVYCASKGATRLMTKAVALECAQLKNGVRVNSVHPGLVDTPSFAQLARELKITGDAVEAAKTLVPIGEVCVPSEVASLVQFLCSSGARHITGAEFVIDGGITAA